MKHTQVQIKEIKVPRNAAERAEARRLNF